MSALQIALLEPPAPPPIILRDYQQDAIAAVEAAAARGVRRQLIVLPTGAGKTIVFASIIDRLLASRTFGRALVLAHRDELVAQAVDKFRLVAGGRYPLGVVKADRNEVDRQILVGSVQTLASPRRLRQLPASELACVVIDECHHAMASTYRRIVEGLGAGQPGGPLLLGFTATPDRGDGQRIGTSVFDELVYSRSILDLMEDGYLCDVEAKSIRLAADLSGIHTRGGDLDAGELARVLLDANAPRRVLEVYQQHAAGRKAIAFTPGVKLAHELARTFRAAGIAAEAADGTTHPAIRRAILARFAAGETRVVCNDSILTEGFDEPSVDCIIMARPTKSRPLYAQIIGRGLRPSPGKVNCLVLDLCGNAGRHDLASMPEVFGLAARGEVASAKEAAKQEREQREISERQRVRDLERGRLVSKVVQLFRRGAGSSMHWVPCQLAGSTIMLLSLGDGLLKVGEAAPDSWAVVLNRPGEPPRLLWRNLAQHRAQRQAEDYAVQCGKPYAFRPGLAWRAAPASRKVRVYARARGVELPERCTAGEASDAMLRHQAIHGFGEKGAPPHGERAQVGR